MEDFILRIQNNITAVNANKNYKKNNSSIEKSLKKLSSGYDINIAADNAAGIAISEKMKTQIFGMDKALENIQQGRSVAQTADGALQEVNDILIRARELTIAAQNSTYSELELDAVNLELSNLTSEIDRIAKSTNINGIHPLVRTVYQPGVDINFNEIELKANLSDPPLSSNGIYNIGARTVDSFEHPTNWGLVFGSGNTSYEQLRVRIPKFDTSGNPITGESETINISLNSSRLNSEDASMSIIAGSYSHDSATNTWSLKYSYKMLVSGAGSDSDPNGDPAINPPKYIDIELTQSIKLNPKDKSDSSFADNNVQYYDISYSIENKSSDYEIDFDFMHHFDTAYNNNDAVERYYVGGNRVEKSTMYNNSDMPESFSIWGPISELPFTGSVIIDSNKPDYLYLGHYRQNTPVWSNFDNPESADNTTLYPGIDLGFSMVWKNEKLNIGTSQAYTFRFGIESTQTDGNIKQDEILEIDKFPGIWIQSGSEKEDGFYMHTCDATASNLRLDPPGLKVENLALALDSLKRIDNAIDKVVSFRGNFGSDMNRLDYAENVGKILQENITASESRIRDADMAKEYTNFVKNNILLQASQSMIAQANLQPQSILNLLK